MGVPTGRAPVCKCKGCGVSLARTDCLLTPSVSFFRSTTSHKADIGHLSSQLLAKRTIDWGLLRLQAFYAENKRELLGGGPADCEFWKRLLGSCNDLACWRRTRFVNVVRHNQGMRVKFRVANRDPRIRRSHDVEYKEASKVLPDCRTLRSSAIHVYDARLLHESPAVRNEVNAVVDALSAIEGDFAQFKGFKAPGAWGVLADGSVTSAASPRKRRASRRAKKIGSPKAQKGSPQSDGKGDDVVVEGLEEEMEDAASTIGALWVSRRSAFLEKRMVTFFKSDIFIPVTTLLCDVANKAWTIERQMLNLCSEFYAANDGSGPDIAFEDVTAKQLFHLHDQVRCVGKAFDIVVSDPTATWEAACIRASDHFTTSLGALPPTARTINHWGVRYVQQRCLFELNDQGYHKHPWIFDHNEDCKQDALLFLRRNIHGLSTSMFHKHLNDVLLPRSGGATRAGEDPETDPNRVPAGPLAEARQEPRGVVGLQSPGPSDGGRR